MQGQVRFARKEIEGKADQSLIQARRDRSEFAGYRLQADSDLSLHLFSKYSLTKVHIGL